MPRTLPGGRRLRSSISLALALILAGATAAQQDDAALQRRLRDLSPQERARLEFYLGRDSGEARAFSSLDSVPDDREIPTDQPDVVRVEVLPSQDTPSRFGQELFELGPLTFAPARYGPVPDDYELGPGDELVVEAWGEVAFRERVRVDRRGNVSLRDAGRITVSGLSLENAEREIRARLQSVIGGLRSGSTQLGVGLGELRAIRVFVIGEASRPGGYEVGAAATIFQALYAAGGPSALGSMREIQLVRQGKVVSRLDLYRYLAEGVREGDATLREGDTVFIPVAKRTIRVLGRVRRQADYELIDGETLPELLRFAGGLSPDARADVVRVERVLPPELRDESGRDRIDVDLPLAPGGGELFDGDIVHVLPVRERSEDYVSVGGAVAYPGRYGWSAGQKLDELLERAGGLWQDARADRAILVRTDEEYRRSARALDLSEGSVDRSMSLAALDSVHVFSVAVPQAERRVAIHGEVREPKSTAWFEGMTLGDLVLMAGGLREWAEPLEAEISRVTTSSGGSDSLAAILTVPLGREGLSAEAIGFVLENHDHVFVRKEPGFELQRNVRVSGEVLYPGIYTLRSREERLSSVIGRAGGLLATAYPPGFRMERMYDEVGNIGLDLRRALEKPGSDADIILVAGDVITVPPRPMSVRVEGEVGRPTSILYRPGRSIMDYVRLAGGTTNHSDEGRTKVIYPNGLAAQVRRWWRDPGVEPGSVIVVPERDPRDEFDWRGAIIGTTQVLASLATVILVIDNVGN